jgi:hypothetical protein
VPAQAFKAPNQQPLRVEGPRFKARSIYHLEQHGYIDIVIPIEPSRETQPIFARQSFHFCPILRLAQERRLRYTGQHEG